MVLSVTIRLNILGISPSALLPSFYSPLVPLLIFSSSSSPPSSSSSLSLPSSSPHPYAPPPPPVKSVISPIVIGWFFVFWPMVGRCS